MEHVASKLPAVRLEKDRVQEIRSSTTVVAVECLEGDSDESSHVVGTGRRKRNMAVMRDLKYSIQMAMVWFAPSPHSA